MWLANFGAQSNYWTLFCQAQVFSGEIHFSYRQFTMLIEPRRSHLKLVIKRFKSFQVVHLFPIPAQLNFEER
jgi:hypothetical protein